ncbi:transcriptional regulator with XRE-family HTH domain [Kitasatospora sp. MAP12-15]|uniref:helix-turn-helix domain-containing protein n=1 Tax=unclassified Kitasatospora TaxID=2633591 RepID=UPI0024735F33|nr:helix-turn-helix transcriptional regulator [Kitasatospora sp. MAP12-44]MDH6112879.1 transcriptional regulator with XRE-family HTH domain [Kitasatospora sp. MAP12-44]
MPNEASSSPLNWRYCGDQLKRWRTLAGVTREELSKAANYEYETIKSMEQGRRKPSLRVLEVADGLCDARGLLMAAGDFLRPEKFPARTQEFMAAEDDAIAMQWFEGLLIPGLLQTEEYARTLISGYCPPLDDETVDERVAARLQRQEKLHRKPPALFGFVIYEAALRTGAGGPAAMKRQLQHLLQVGELRNVSVQVLRAGHGALSCLEGPIILLETSEHEQLAYSEGQDTSALHSDTKTVGSLTQRHGMIRMQALSSEESALFISGLAEEL